MTYDIYKFYSYDVETWKSAAGDGAPPIVCASTARIVADEIVTNLLPSRSEALACAREILCSDAIMVGANIAYDLACLAAADETLLPLIFQAIRAGRVYDILIAQSLDAIAGGHLGYDPRTGKDLRHPATNKVTKRYSLAVCVDLVLGRQDAKERDDWRTSYALLDGVPVDKWPENAKQYPIDDAVNTLEVAIAQVTGWRRGQYDCDPDYQDSEMPCRNLGNLSAQVEAAFCLHLGACWGLRTDGERVERLAAEVDKKHAAAVERFQKLGWIRPDGTEDQIAVKRAIAAAYGAEGKCPVCEGSGKLPKTKVTVCRGEKVRGRYAGCTGALCAVCGGKGEQVKPDGEMTCKVVLDADGKPEMGCDGTGLDLSTAPMLPRSEKGGVKTDRDAAMESGDEDVSDYGDSNFEKLRTTYIPYLRTGANRPITFSANSLVATGRCSYEHSPVHQFPRKGGVRECIVARPGHVLASTDYAAGELCTLAAVSIWTVGHSKMAEIINETQDPGALHTFFASKMLGKPFEEVQALVKAKDKTAVDFRQAAKCADFGLPGGMGSATFVAAKRKKIEGETKAPDGLVYAGIRFCILLTGAERCGVEKVTKWGKRDITPLCKTCLEVVEEVLKPAFFDTYPEVQEYLDWVANKVRMDGYVPQLAWDSERQKVVELRRRADSGYCANANSLFQGLLADIGKFGFCEITREGYLGVKGDGSISPLARVRYPLFLHDDPVAEIPEDIAHLAGPRIAEIMVAAGKRFAPDVFWKAEPALSKMMSKDAEPVYRNGRLVPWEPKEMCA